MLYTVSKFISMMAVGAQAVGVNRIGDSKEDKDNADGDGDEILFWATFVASKLHIKSTCP